jgi:hypothetical protein
MPFRIASHPNAARLSEEKAPADAAKDYVARLLRLIPGEIVALYLAGRAAITGYFEGSQSSLSEPRTWIVWTVVCLGLLFVVRIWGTRDKKLAIPPEWRAIGIAAASFVIWVYSSGDVFKIAFNVWNPLIATLLVLVWTFLTPFIYNPEAKASP